MTSSPAFDSKSLSIAVYLPGPAGKTMHFEFSSMPHQLRIGSDPACDVCFPFDAVRPIHLTIERSANRVCLVDELRGSTLNGTPFVRTLLPENTTALLVLGTPKEVLSAVRAELRYQTLASTSTGPGSNERLQHLVEPIPDDLGPGGRVDLTLMVGSHRQDRTLADGEEVTIGRSNRCGVVVPLDAEGVSGNHARLYWERGWLVFEDSSSTNGTWIDGRRVGRVILRPQVQHRIGLAGGGGAFLLVQVLARPSRDTIAQPRPTVAAVPEDILQPAVPEDDGEWVSVVIRPAVPEDDGESVVRQPAVPEDDGESVVVPPTTLLEALVSYNPKRPGSASHARYERYLPVYLAGGTVAEALSAGATMADIRWDVARGFVRPCAPDDREAFESTSAEIRALQRTRFRPSSKEERDTTNWVDLEASAAGAKAPASGSLLETALKLMADTPGGATLTEMKSAFIAREMGHHDPKRLLVWASRHRGWGFVMDPETGRIRAIDTRLRSKNEEVSKAVPAAALPVNNEPPQVDRVEERIRAEPELLLRSERELRDAERKREADERRAFEEERRAFEEERRQFRESQQANDFSDVPKTDPMLVVIQEELQATPAWLLDLPESVRAVFKFLAEHGQINEQEATTLLGGARQFRRFSVDFPGLSARAPFRVRIETMGGLKAYIRED